MPLAVVDNFFNLIAYNVRLVRAGTIVVVVEIGGRSYGWMSKISRGFL